MQFLVKNTQQADLLVLMCDRTPSFFLVTYLLSLHYCSLVALHFPKVICQSNQIRAV